MIDAWGAVFPSFRKQLPFNHNGCLVVDDTFNVPEARDMDYVQVTNHKTPSECTWRSFPRNVFPPGYVAPFYGATGASNSLDVGIDTNNETLNVGHNVEPSNGASWQFETPKITI